MNTVQKTIKALISSIEPFDDLEREHIAQVIEWVDSGQPLFRISKPDNPPMHLVSYFVMHDATNNKLLLIDHVKAKAWLPPGGHVDQGEDPRSTVVREAMEELGLDADFNSQFGDNPVLLTVTTTKGYGNHSDVSLWFVIDGNSTQLLKIDTAEMHGYKWLTPSEILAMDITLLDPHMHRLIHKIFTTQTLSTAQE